MPLASCPFIEGAPALPHKAAHPRGLAQGHGSNRKGSPPVSSQMRTDRLAQAPRKSDTCCHLQATEHSRCISKRLRSRQPLQFSPQLQISRLLTENLRNKTSQLRSLVPGRFAPRTRRWDSSAGCNQLLIVAEMEIQDKPEKSRPKRRSQRGLVLGEDTPREEQKLGGHPGRRGKLSILFSKSAGSTWCPWKRGGRILPRKWGRGPA